MKNKKVYVILIVLILIGSLFLTYNIYQNKNKVIKTKKRKQNNLAIMIKEDGAADYTKSNSKDIPKGDYVLNRDKSYCKNNGVIGYYDSSLGKVSFSFIGTDSCYLYFDYKEDTSLYGTIKKRAQTDTTYLALYTGEGADTYANPVYYYKGNVQNNNVLFAGFCWKIVRTTETGGVKIVYNGVQKNGSCNNTGTDSQIGESVFNEDGYSPAYVGYMHNIVYQTSSKSMSSQSNIVFGNSFNYNSNNGIYTLKDTKTVATWSSGYNTINNNHYTCMTTGTTCSSIYYVYYTDSSKAYYITLTNGKSVNDALNEMLYANDVNKNDSTIKAYIDSWYESNIKGKYEDKLEDTVFCNDRLMSNESSNGWNPNGGSTSTYLEFKNYNRSNQSLVCANETDRFSHSNTKAYLKYPIGLLSVPELSLARYRSSHYFNSGQYVGLASPSRLDITGAIVSVAYSGGLLATNAYGWRSVRPSVSLKPKTYFSTGDGSFTNPFVIGDAVEEPSDKSFDTVFAANNTDIFNEKGIRYEGANPNNYICLDNKTSGACSNNSLLFRIIGLFDEDTSTDGTSSSGTKKLLKVIDTNNYGVMGWDDNSLKNVKSSINSSDKYKIIFLAADPDDGTNNWSTATLKNELNGTYLTTLLGTSNVNSKLSSGVATAKWHLGGVSSSYSTLTAEGIYTQERNTTAIYSGNPASIYAKVGLMYPSDYGYATGGTTTNRAGCRAKALYNYDTADCKNNDWLFTSQNSFANDAEWLLSPYSTRNYIASILYSTGSVMTDGVGKDHVVRPTFYLDSSVLKIVGTGDGTKDNAYRVG